MVATTNNHSTIKWLTYTMFMMFGMTTDAVGEIIPEVMEQFSLGMTAAGLLHYCPMTAIAFGGIFLGFLADKLGRKKTIVLGLVLFASSCVLFLLGNAFGFFLILLIIAGLAIGIFKTGALALIGDVSHSAKEHTASMNAAEGFFGVGAILGPFLVSYFLSQGVEWKWLYVVAGALCLVLILIAAMAKYPQLQKTTEEPIDIARTLRMVKDKYALGFSVGIFMYVAVEAGIYVWMPTLISGYDGSLILLATYALSTFFVLRAVGRFLGVWMIARLKWSMVLLISSLLILLCYVGSFISETATVVLLPLSGLFMSVVYPTINSKGISCFPKAKHGAAAGILLFFTAAGAALGPLSMGVVSDLFGSNPRVGFMLATVFASVLFVGSLYNHVFQPTEARLKSIEESEYE